MGVELLIRDGDPYWYLSPNIWVVSVTDPDGPPVSPVAGQQAYLRARLENTGDVAATDVRVDFFWANPALQITRKNATFVGSGNANVPARSASGDVSVPGTQEVLCLVPWEPLIVNEGHECLIAVANHASDPLPTPPPDAFDPPRYRQVAQRNLTVLGARTKTMLTLTVGGLPRLDKAVRVRTEVGGELDADTLASLGLGNLRPAGERFVEVGLHRQSRCVADDEPIGEAELGLQVPRGTSAAVYVAVRSEQLPRDQYQLVHILEWNEEQRVLGGMGLVVTWVTEGDG